MKKYVFAGCVERVPSGGFSLFFPDLSGCITAGEDMTQLASRAREALELHLEGMSEDGLPIPAATPPEEIVIDPEFDIVGLLLVEASAVRADQVVLELSAEALRRADEAATATGRTRASVLEAQIEATAAA